MVVQHQTRGVRLPLARNFFRELHAGLDKGELNRIIDENRRLYDYIEHYWKLGPHDLTTADFDLEECFTLLQQHEKDARRSKHDAGYDDLWVIKGQLTALFAGLLDEISANQRPGAEGLKALARRILNEEATVVTFNYDTLLEQAMIEESTGRPWNPIQAYGASFDEFKQQDGAPFAEFRFARFPARAPVEVHERAVGTMMRDD